MSAECAKRSLPSYVLHTAVTSLGAETFTPLAAGSVKLHNRNTFGFMGTIFGGLDDV